MQNLFGSGLSMLYPEAKIPERHCIPRTLSGQVEVRSHIQGSLSPYVLVLMPLLTDSGSW